MNEALATLEAPAPKVGNRPNHDHITASEIQRVALCPGSYRMRLKYPEPQGARDPDADEGSLLHEALRIDDWQGLDEEQEGVARTALRQRDEVFGFIGEPEHYLTLKEKRLYARDGLKPILSGQADAIAVEPMEHKVAAIVDYKMLWGDHVTADRNLQARALAVLAHEEFQYRPEVIYVAIIQPRAGQPSVAKYDDSALEDAHAEVHDYLRAAYAEDAPLIPGERQCKYCPAAIHCPASKQNMELVSRLHFDIEACPPEEMLDLYRRSGAALQLANQIRAAIKGQLKRWSAEGIENDLTAALELVQTRGQREVTDPEEAYTRLVNGAEGVAGLGPKAAEVFAAAAKVRIGELQKQWRWRRPVGHHKNGRVKYITHKQAEEELSVLLSDLVTRKEKEPEVKEKT